MSKSYKFIITLILFLVLTIGALISIRVYKQSNIKSQPGQKYFAVIPKNTKTNKIKTFLTNHYTTGTNSILNIVILTNKQYISNGKTNTPNKDILGTLKENYPNSQFHTLNIQNLKIKNNSYKNILQNLNFPGNTLFIGLLDFQNNLTNDFSKIYKRKLLYKLNSSKQKQTYNLLSNKDSQKLNLINKLAIKLGYEPFLLKNSSLPFIYYKKSSDTKTTQNGITLAFYGDLIYDRYVKILLDSEEKIRNHFSGFQNQKLSTVDYAGFNLETPILKEGESCMPSGKSVKFCSKYTILPVLKDIGFNLVNLANNHSMDSGVRDHKNTIQNLEQIDLDHFGYIRHGSLFEKNYIYTGNIRGINVAFHGFDFSITPDLQNKYCDIIKDYDNKGFVNILSLHWGIEYSSKPSKFQKNLAYKLIDCGGDIIIGHGPHVTQPTEVYKDRLIVYSLGNFLFDQYFSQPTQKGLYILADINPNGEIQNYFTGDIKSSPKKEE